MRVLTYTSVECMPGKIENFWNSLLIFSFTPDSRDIILHVINTYFTQNYTNIDILTSRKQVFSVKNSTELI